MTSQPDALPLPNLASGTAPSVAPRTPDPDSVEAAWRGFGLTPRMVDLLSERTGVPYPWAKYDQAVAPDYIFGGMENVTATTQADDRILHPPWAQAHANAEALVAHELAHQWYGNKVTPADWSEIWLSAEDWAAAFRSPDRGTPHNEAREAIMDELIEILIDSGKLPDDGEFDGSSEWSQQRAGE